MALQVINTCKTFNFPIFLESETIHLEEKDHIRWQLRDLRMSSKGASTSLRLRFKAASKDGVIFYTKRYGNILLVELNNGVLRVAAGKATESMLCLIIVSVFYV